MDEDDFLALLYANAPVPDEGLISDQSKRRYEWALKMRGNFEKIREQHEKKRLLHSGG